MSAYLRAVCLFLSLAGAAATWSAPPAAATPEQPRISLSLPGAVASGVRAAATGRARPFGRATRVELQAWREGRWKPLATAPLSRSRFRVSFVLEGAAMIRVRAELLTAGRPVATSAIDRVRVEAAPPSPTSPPASATGSPPASSSPPMTEAPTSIVPAPPPIEVPTEEPVEPPASSQPSYWGAWIGPQFTGTPAPEDMNAVTDFETLTGKPLSLLETYSQWAACPGSSPSCKATQPFPRAQFEKMRDYGAIPLYSWASEGNGEAGAQSEFQLADIIAGRFDSYIRGWAEEARAWGHPFFLRFDWEMNGTWFPWSEGVDGNHPGEYVTAWQHVHDIFTEVGATNATWLWCPYVNPNGNLQSPATLYPGDGYVDWTCLDGYNRGTTLSPSAPYRSFDYLFGPDYRQITQTLAPSKPMLLAEVASSENGGSKSEWIDQMFDQLSTAYPKVRGLMWFDYEEGGNRWPLESSTAATQAFATGVGNPRYLSNSFAATADGPVPLP